MFSATADLYDEIYAFKNYAEEASKIQALVERERPGAKSILDIACGTAEHARFLSGNFELDGIDIEPKFVEIARAKNPTGTYSVADMRTFDLGKHYDVIQCLFSSIGYLLTPEDTVATLKRFQAHLAPGGVLLVEPWFPPTAYKTGVLHMTLVDKPNLKICRMSVSERDGNVSIIHFHYLIATTDGVRRAEESYRLALVTTEQMAAYMEVAGLESVFDPVGLFDRGLFICRPAK